MSSPTYIESMATSPEQDVQEDFPSFYRIRQEIAGLKDGLKRIEAELSHNKFTHEIDEIYMRSLSKRVRIGGFEKWMYCAVRNTGLLCDEVGREMDRGFNQIEKILDNISTQDMSDET